MTEAGARLTADLRGAGPGLLRLMRFDPRWAEGFDASVGGFVRSFAGPLLALPAYLVVAAILSRVQIDAATATAVAPDQIFLSRTLDFVLSAAAYPLLIAIVARVFELGEGYGAFIVVTNWAQVFLNGFLAVASLMALLGDVGVGAFGLTWLLLTLASLYITWRAARETLSTDFAPAMLAVVLLVAVDVGTSQLAGLLIPDK